MAIQPFYPPGQGNPEFTPISKLDWMWITGREKEYGLFEFGIIFRTPPQLEEKSGDQFG
jgi:hypothetical protein